MFILEKFSLNHTYEIQSDKPTDIEIYTDNFLSELRFNGINIYSSGIHRDFISLLIINSNSSTIKSISKKYFKEVDVQEIKYLKGLPPHTQELFKKNLSADQPSCKLYKVSIKVTPAVIENIRYRIHSNAIDTIYNRLGKPLIFNYEGSRIYTTSSIDLNLLNTSKISLGIVSNKGKTLVKDEGNSFYVEKLLTHSAWSPIYNNLFIQDNSVVCSLKPYIVEKLKGIIKSNVKARSIRFVWLKDDNVIRQFQIKANDLERDMIVYHNKDEKEVEDLYTQMKYPTDHIQVVKTPTTRASINKYSLAVYIILLLYAIYLWILKKKKLTSLLLILTGLYSPLASIITGLLLFRPKLLSLFLRLSILISTRFISTHAYMNIFFYKMLIVNLLIEIQNFL